MLEDLHWADESSLFVMNYLARNINDENIIILGTLRPEIGDYLQNTIEQMSQKEHFSLISLEKLGSNAVSSLVEALHPDHNFPQSFIDHLIESSGGNPFFVIEMLREMKDEGNISSSDEGDSLINLNYSIPNSVEEIVQRRLERLDVETMAFAEYASCIGKIFNPEVVLSLQSSAFSLANPIKHSKNYRKAAS